MAHCSAYRREENDALDAVVLIDYDNCPYAAAQVASLGLDDGSGVAVYIFTNRPIFVKDLEKSFPAAKVIPVRRLKQEADVVMAVVAGQLDATLRLDTALFLVSTDAIFESISWTIGTHLPHISALRRKNRDVSDEKKARICVRIDPVREHAGLSVASYLSDGSVRPRTIALKELLNWLRKSDPIASALALVRNSPHMAEIDAEDTITRSVERCLAADSSLRDSLSKYALNGAFVVALELLRLDRQGALPVHAVHEQRRGHVTGLPSDAFPRPSNTSAAASTGIGKSVPPVSVDRAQKAYSLEYLQRKISALRSLLAKKAVTNANASLSDAKQRAFHSTAAKIEELIAQGYQDVQIRENAFAFTPFRAAFKDIVFAAMDFCDTSPSPRCTVPGALIELKRLDLTRVDPNWKSYVDRLNSVHAQIRSAQGGVTIGTLAATKTRYTGTMTALLLIDLLVRLTHWPHPIDEPLGDALTDSMDASSETPTHTRATTSPPADIPTRAPTSTAASLVGYALALLERTDDLRTQLERFQSTFLAPTAVFVVAGMDDVEGRPHNFAFESFRAALKQLLLSALARRDRPALFKSSVPQLLLALDRDCTAEASGATTDRGDWAAFVGHCQTIYESIKTGHGGNPGVLTRDRNRYTGMAAVRLLVDGMLQLERLSAN